MRAEQLLQGHGRHMVGLDIKKKPGGGRASPSDATFSTTKDESLASPRYGPKASPRSVEIMTEVDRAVSKNDEFRFKNKELFIKNKELCTKNKEFCTKHKNFALKG